jgi:diguanylate cyclase (GGDEF)-like protein/PAS domain S-box-containing protein
VKALKRLIAGHSIRGRGIRLVLLVLIAGLVAAIAVDPVPAAHVVGVDPPEAMDTHLIALALIAVLSMALTGALISLLSVGSQVDEFVASAVRARGTPPAADLRELQELGVALADLKTEMAARRREAGNARSAESAAEERSVEVSGRLQDHTERFGALVLNVSDVILVVNESGLITYFTPSLATLLGHRPKLFSSLDSIVRREDMEQIQRTMAASAAGSSLQHSVEFRVADALGEWRTFDAVVTDSRDHPAVRGFVINGRDITDRKDLEEQLTQRAFYDPLTRLPNRSLLMDRLAQKLLKVADRDRAVSVLFIDVDRFKNVNDSLGHAAGDGLLEALASRLQQVVGPTDTIARFGGDEFIVLVDGLEEAALNLATQIMADLAMPLALSNQEILVGVSIGIATTDDSAISGDELVRRSDVALYQAKTAGRGRAAIYEHSTDAFTRERLALEADLRGAAARGELFLEYQPYADLASGEVQGLEALVRWQHPERGTIPPNDFIPLAEETGTIVEIGRWVLKEASEVFRHRQLVDPDYTDRVLNVNLAPRELRERDLVTYVRQVLAETGLKPCALQLEITEGALVDDAEETAVILAQLKDLGVRLAVDDFGTGYSSLSYLARLPLDTVKIDRSFVTHLGSDPRSEAICRSIVALARSLDMDVVAEGIETRAQLMRLRALGCRRGQGWLIARPVPAESLDTLRAAGSLAA